LLVRVTEGLSRPKRCGSSKRDVRSVRMCFLDTHKQSIAATRAWKSIASVLQAASTNYCRANGGGVTALLLQTSRDTKLSFAASSSRCRAFGSFSSARTQLKPTDRRLAQICTAFAVDARKATKNVRTTTPTPPRLQRGNRPTRRPRRFSARRRPAKQPKERRLGRRRPVAGRLLRWW